MKKSNSLRHKLYYLLFYNVHVKKVGFFLLNQSWFVNNPIYQWFLNRYISRIVDRYRETPNLVVIENTNLCNAHCSMCPHDLMKRKTGIMTEEVFRKVVDDCAALGVGRITLHGFGEPLIDRDFAKRVAYVKSRGIPSVGTSSNGALMSKEVAQAVVEAGLDEINFSLDASSKEAYDKIRVGLPYEKVMQNVSDFVETRNQMGQKNPFVIVDLIESDYNQGEAGGFISRWNNIVDKVNITTLHTWGGLYKDKIGKGKFHRLRRELKREPCRFLWTDMVINWDGRITACCQDFENQMIMGDVKEKSVKEIWQGSSLNALRRSHQSGEMDKIKLCRDCDYRSVWWLFK